MPAYKSLTANRLATVFRWIPSIGTDEDLTAYAVRLAYDLGIKTPVDAGVIGHHSWSSMEINNICESMASFLERNKDFQILQPLNVSLPRDHEKALSSAPVSGNITRVPHHAITNFAREIGNHQEDFHLCQTRI